MRLGPTQVSRIIQHIILQLLILFKIVIIDLILNFIHYNEANLLQICLREIILVITLSTFQASLNACRDEHIILPIQHRKLCIEQTVN
jgi:uncharacterized membrane protein YoaK (UPF0700 family)